MRIGIGYDVHRIAPGRPLYLGGIRIPWDCGLDGYSDADVLLHALMGYEAMPSGLQVVFYITTLIVILSAMRMLRNRKDTISSF